MATVKITLDKRASHQNRDGTYPLVLRLGHKSKTRDIPFNIHLFEGQYDNETGMIAGILNAKRHSKRIQKTFADADLWIDENAPEIKLWSIDKLKDEIERQFFNKQFDLTLLNHGAKYLYRLHKENRSPTAKSYEDALKAFVRYQMTLVGQSIEDTIKTLFDDLLENKAQVTQHNWLEQLQGLTVKNEFARYDMPIKAIDPELMKDFKAWMSNKYSKNTVGIYLRSLNAIMNDASDSHADLRHHRPLANIKKGSYENPTEDLDMHEVNLIRQLQFKEGTSKFHARNYALMMFNNMGLNFFDLALIRVFQFDGERINYTRKKTESEGDHFGVKQPQEALDIINYYIQDKEPDDYLFPIMPKDTPPQRLFRVKNDRLGWFNRHIQEIAKMAGIKKRVRSYSFRDTWMNIGLQLGIDIRKLSKGLGHSSVQVTEKHYAALIQQTLFDEINAKITEASFKSPKPAKPDTLKPE